MYCKNCGKEIGTEAKFCPDCGQPVENDNSANQTVNQHLENTQNKLDHFAENMKNKGIEVAGKKFNMLEVITFGSTILTVVACFLPFISMGYYSVSLMDAGKDAIIFIILAGATSILAYLAQDLVALCAAIVTLVYLVIELLDVNRALSSFASLGIGAYLMIIAAVGLVIGTLLVYINNKKHN